MIKHTKLIVHVLRTNKRCWIHKLNFCSYKTIFYKRHVRQHICSRTAGNVRVCFNCSSKIAALHKIIGDFNGANVVVGKKRSNILHVFVKVPLVKGNAIFITSCYQCRLLSITIRSHGGGKHDISTENKLFAWNPYKKSYAQHIMQNIYLRVRIQRFYRYGCNLQVTTIIY